MTSGFIASALVVPVAKFLSKQAFGDGLAAETAGGLFDWLNARLSDGAEARKATRLIEDLAQRVVDDLDGFMKRERLSADPKALADALGATLERVDLGAAMVEAKREPKALRDILRRGAPSHVAELGADYDLVLDRFAAGLCAIADKIDGYAAAKDRRMLEALERLVRDSPEILASIGRIEARQEALEREERQIADENERDYRAELERDVAKLRLFGLDSDDEAHDKFDLKIAYIPLRLTLGDAEGSGVEPLSLDYAEALALLPFLGNRLLIEGIGGSGKTTLLQWTALTALDVRAGKAVRLPDARSVGGRVAVWLDGMAEAERTRLGLDHLHRQLAPLREAALYRIGPAELPAMPRLDAGPGWHERTPFLVRLRDLADGMLPKPEDLVGLIAPQASGTPEGWVRERVRESRALFLFDGIDEAPKDGREKLACGIASYLEDRPGCQVIVTSRPAAVLDPVWREQFGALRVAVRPMAPVDIRKFIEHWHRGLERASKKPVDRETVERLANQVTSRAALTSLAETPLLCAAICCLHQIRGGEIPDRAEKLYAQLCEQLVHRMDEQRLKKDGVDRLVPVLAGIDAERKLDLLARLAAFMVNERVAVLERDRAARIIAEGLAVLPLREKDEPIAVVDAFQERSGILRGTTRDAVEFAHNRLRSFLAARAFKDRLAVAQPIDGALATDDPDLPVLAAAQGSDGYRGRLITELLRRAAAVEDGRPLSIMALRCGVTGEFDPKLRTTIIDLTTSILPPRTLDEAGQLAELGARIVPQLTFVPDREATIDAACVRCLRLISGAGLAALEGYLEHGSAEVVEELAQAMNPLRIAAVEQFVRSPDITCETYTPLKHLREPDLAIVQDWETLNLPGAAITEATCLARMRKLRRLSLAWTRLKDLSPLGELIYLEHLDLSDTDVTDLTPLAGLTRLQSLKLSGANITDLNPLAKLEEMEFLDLSGTDIVSRRTLMPLVRLRNLRIFFQDGIVGRLDPKFMNHLDRRATVLRVFADQWVVTTGRQPPDWSE